MAQTKQEIVRLIAQGKIQTALEGLIQLSGAIKDKELQQRCILLYSQLSQLKGSLGAGTLDNKIYQLEINRITDAALQAASELPSTTPAQQQQTNRQHGTQAATGSVWKTWGILLTGAVGLIIVLGIIRLVMNEDASNLSNQDYQSGTDNSETTRPLETAIGQPASQNFTSSNTGFNPVAEPVRNGVEDRFVGSWNGALSASGIALGYVNITFMTDRRFISYAVDPYSGERMEADRGRWALTSNGMLSMTSNNGAYENFYVVWSNADAFQARLMDATSSAMIGMDVSFARAY